MQNLFRGQVYTVYLQQPLSIQWTYNGQWHHNALKLKKTSHSYTCYKGHIGDKFHLFTHAVNPGIEK